MKEGFDTRSTPHCIEGEALQPLIRPDSFTVLREERCRKSLARYFSILQDEKYAQFQVARKVAVDFSEKSSLEELWDTHRRTLPLFRELRESVDEGKRLASVPTPKTSLHDLKTLIARHILSRCHLCKRRCGANRLNGELGYCRCGKEVVVSSFFEHMGEEPELVPSGTIFTCGCTLRCLHCQNYTISQWLEEGEVLSPEALAAVVDALKARGCRNANLVGGDPTSWLGQWLEVFRHVRSNIAVVWNSNSYYSVEAAELLKGFADVYLLDFKYGPGGCAERISDAPGYWDVAARNHLTAKEWGELIIRLLVLPGHLDCCLTPVLEWVAENLGVETRVNIMFQFRPEWRASEIPELTAASPKRRGRERSTSPSR